MNVITPAPINHTNTDFLKEIEKVEKSVPHEKDRIQINVNQEYKKIEEEKRKKEQY